MDIAFLCGGEGTRLRPLTYVVPKPMLPIGSKPILHINIESITKQGFNRVFLMVNYKAEIIEGYFGDGESFGIPIEYVVEDEPRGTAGSLSRLIDVADDPLVVMNADVLTDLSLQKLLQFHEKKSSHVTIALKQIQMDIPYGVVKLDDEKTVTLLEEKPREKFLINSGIYVVSHEAMMLIPQHGIYHMTDLINDVKAKGMSVVGLEFDDKWRDIGRLDDYLKAADSNNAESNGSNIQDIQFVPGNE